jgi:hypothetical protein
MVETQFLRGATDIEMPADYVEDLQRFEPRQPHRRSLRGSRLRGNGPESP